MRSSPPLLSFAPLLVALACGNQAQDAVTLTGPPADAVQPDAALPAAELPDADVPDAADSSSTACIVSADCPGAKDLCLQGMCVAQVPCQSDKQCAASNQVCEPSKGVCVPCTSSADCLKGETCKANQCLPPPESCVSSKDCKKGQVCDKALKACVECATAADCDKGFGCQQTVCVPLACAPGASKCGADGQLQTCKGDGSGLESKPCAAGSVCLTVANVGAACQAQVCTPGNVYCDGTKVMTCDATSTAPTLAIDCLAISKEKSTCAGGKCVPAPVGQAGYLLRAGFVSVPDMAGGAYRIVDQGWLTSQTCAGTYCLRGGFQP